MNLTKMLRRVASAILLGLSGSVFVNCGGAYGSPVPPDPPPPHDPSVVLLDFSYTPASPIHMGDALHLTATLNKPTAAGIVFVDIGDPWRITLFLNDYGASGDAVAGDGVCSAYYEWDAWGGTGSDLPVVAELSWLDHTPGQTLDGPPLTVLPAEEGQ